MTLEEMQRRKREFGYSNEKLAELSGVPLGTVQKVMSGSTKSPRQGTLEALARALNGQKEVPTRYPGEMIDGCIRVLREPWGAYAAKKEEYTIEDIYALPEGVRAELITWRRPRERIRRSWVRCILQLQVSSDPMGERVKCIFHRMQFI